MNLTDWEIIRKVILIRMFEKVVQDLYRLDYIQSPVHLSIGHGFMSYRQQYP